MFAVPDYQLGEHLHTTRYAILHRAQQNADQRPVVLKFLHNDYPSQAELAHFRREYELTRRFQGPGVIEALALLPHQNSLVMVLEDFGGISLREVMGRGALPLETALTLALRLAETLARLHAQGAMHKDLTPANILLNPLTGELKLIDFGLTTLLVREESSTRAPQVLEGTLPYLSPEQTGRMNRAVDYRTDFYALGVVLYELLTGRRPFEAADPLELIHAHLALPPVPPITLNPSLPPILSEIVLKLLAKTAEARYQSAEGLRADLAEVLHQWQVSAEVRSFPLGQQDRADRFQLPQTLYGRNSQRAALLAAFDRASEGRTELLLVSAYAGMGKTTLIHELHKPIVARRGYFLVGSFDLLQREVPYTALSQAFGGLVRQLLTESDAQIARWRERLMAALGSNGQVLIEIIPELAWVIGAQPAVADLPPAEAQHRFHLLFENMVRLLAQPEHPLVLFLDDLQWADRASLSLLEHLLTTSEGLSLLVIGAYRDNEVPAGHPLDLALKSLRKGGLPIEHTSLPPLGSPEVLAFLRETFQEPSQVVEALVPLLLAKTGGNPFFLREFLKALHREGLILLDPGSGRWQWELAKIERHAVTDNVVELLVRQVEQLSPATQIVLQHAACMGQHFDLATLAVVAAKSPQEVATLLELAIATELIQPVDEGHEWVLLGGDAVLEEVTVSYEFAHDRVQQATYSMLPPEEQSLLHWRIGKLLWSQTLPERREEPLFEIVQHLNRGRRHLGERAEAIELARLNLQAGRRANLSAAFEPALAFLAVGIELLGESSWQEEYELSLALHEAAAEAAYLNGEYEQMEAWVETLLAEARTLLDTVKVRLVRMRAYQNQYRLQESLQVGLEALRELGIFLPETVAFEDIGQAFEELREALGARSISDLADLPLMEAPEPRAAMRFLNRLSGVAFNCNPMLSPLITVAEVKLSLKHGNAPESAVAYATYGFLLSGLGSDDIETVYRFGQLGLSLLHLPGAQRFEARTRTAFEYFIRPWKMHLRESLPGLLDAYQKGLETGDIEMAAWGLVDWVIYGSLGALELGTVAEALPAYRASLERLRQKTALNLLSIFELLLSKWRVPGEDLYHFAGASYEEMPMIPHYVETGDHTSLCSLYLGKLMLACHFRQHDQAVAYAEQTEPHLTGMMSSFPISLFHFYDSLARLAILADLPEAEQAPLLERVARNQAKLAHWTSHAPMNYQHKWHLVEAERARVQGENGRAWEHYQQAIRLAQAEGYLADEGLANELAAAFYLDYGQHRVALLHLRDAHYAYQRWGAEAKVRDLEQRYPDLLPLLSSPTAFPREGSSGRPGTTSSSGLSEQLDLLSVVKASQTISGEIELDRLLAMLLRLILENAGAQRGCLVLAHNGELRIEAEGSVDPPTMRTLQGQPVESGRGDQPLSGEIAHYVARTQQSVVLEQATEEPLFGRTPYIRAEQPHSILCAPLLNQGKLIGLIYLEHRLMTNVFTPARAELVQLLGTQAAISITNAQAFAARAEQERLRLEKQLLEQRAQDLAELNASKDKFFSIISHDLRSPFNGLLGISHLLELYSDSMSQKEIADYAGRIHGLGKQVLALLDNLLDWSQMQTGRMIFHPTSVDLQIIIERTIGLLEGTATNKGITLINHLTAPMLVYGDGNMLETVVRNLLSNALKFTHSGGQVCATTRLQGDWVEVSVIDTGIGMKQETREKLFRLDTTHTTRGTAQERGTGLGLLLCQEMVLCHGGRIWVDSVPGEGSTFSFTVPCTADVQAPTLEMMGRKVS